MFKRVVIKLISKTDYTRNNEIIKENVDLNNGYVNFRIKQKLLV